MKIVVYTAAIGGIDPLWSALPDSAEYAAFVDAPKREAGLWGGKPPHILSNTAGIAAPPTWKQRSVAIEGDARRTARLVKTLPHRYMPDADVWIWVDGNVRLRITAAEAVRRWLRGGIAIPNHPDRRDVYQEAEACIKFRKDDAVTLQRQARRYELDGHPRGWGLAETRIVIRRNMPAIRALNEAWWVEIDAGSVRDQVALPYVCWKAGIRWDTLPGRVNGDKHPHIWHTQHTGRRR